MTFYTSGLVDLKRKSAHISKAGLLHKNASPCSIINLDLQQNHKMAREEARLRMTLFVAVVIAFVVLMVGVTTDYWGQSRRTSAIHYGLWKSCGSIGVSDQSPIRCFSPEDKRVSDWKRASRAFMVLSCLTFVVAILYVLMLQIKPRLPSILLAFILTISLLCSLTGVAVYTARSGILQVPGLEFGFSYMLVWGGIGMNAFGVLLSCCDQAGYHFF